MSSRKQSRKSPMTLPDAAHRFWESDEARLCFSGCERVAVGVSGGADSMALLYLMAADAHRPDWAPAIVVAHVNHCLRGAESDRDEACAKALASELGVVFRVRTLDPEKLKREAKRCGSLEAAAREERYRGFRDICSRGKCGTIALAHHRDDLAETFLMRLLRGSGLSGLGGFGPMADVMGVRVARPLIDWSREELRGVAKMAGIEWGEDASNDDPAFMRNRIRHRVLPYLEHHTDHPPVSRVLARTARLLDREGQAVQKFVATLYARHRKELSRPRRIGLPIKLLAHSDESIFAPYLLREMMIEISETPYPPSEERIAEIEAFLLSTTKDALLQTAGNVVLWISPDDVLWAYRKTERRVERKKLLSLFRKG